MPAHLNETRLSSTPKYLLRGTAVWFLIALAETVHGILRTLFLQPVVGDQASRQIGVFTGSLMILLIAYAAIGWIGARGTRPLLTLGLMWVLLMILFEVGVGRALGLSWARIISDYIPWKGGFMLLGMLVLAFSPLIATRLRSLHSSNP